MSGMKRPEELPKGGTTNLPFAHLNLRRNPFGSLSRDERVELAVVDLKNLPIALAEPGTAIQFLGPEGHGKTTHLISLHALFADKPYIQIHPGDRPKFSRSDLQFVDSIDHLSARQRRKIYGKSKSLACTTHVDVSPEMAAAGFRVHTCWIGGYDAKRVKEVIHRRIEFARRDAGLVPTIDDEEVDHLMTRFGDDMRGMEWHLYEVFQRLEGIVHVKV
jgi:hypothetical protein